MAQWDEWLRELNRLRQSRPQQGEAGVRVEDHSQPFIKALSDLAGVRLLIGIPQESGRSDGQQITNAVLGYIHETGSPINNIPARPFLVPGVKNSRDQWMPYLQRAGEAALGGDGAAVLVNLDKAGITATNAVKQRIQAGIPPPLKRPRYRKGRAPQRPEDATPLYDTGDLLRSITWVVEKK